MSISDCDMQAILVDEGGLSGRRGQDSLWGFSVSLASHNPHTFSFNSIQITHSQARNYESDEQRSTGKGEACLTFIFLLGQEFFALQCTGLKYRFLLLLLLLLSLDPTVAKAIIIHPQTSLRLLKTACHSAV